MSDMRSSRPTSIAERVRAALAARPAKGVVAAVSGGPDSVAMLAILHEVKVAQLTIGHVDHRLRPDSGSDAEFVKQLGNRFGLTVAIETIDVKNASDNRNIEAIARRLRYQALRKIATDSQADTIVTAHTLDDQAETVLLRLLRGTGLVGLAGIAPSFKQDGIRVTRPMLNTRRSELLDYLRINAIDYRIDCSNSDRRFARNRLRQVLIPSIEEFANAGWQQRLADLAGEARQFGRRVARQARKDLRRMELPRAGPICVLDQRRSVDQTRDRLQNIMRAIWNRENWSTVDMTRQHWQRLADFFRGESLAIDMPGGIRARRIRQVVRIGPGA